MTKSDVVENFKIAAEAVKGCGIEFEQESLAGLTLQLTDRLLQIQEMEEKDRRITPVIAGQSADRSLRGLN